MSAESKIRTCLWFNGNGGDAVDFYVSLLPDSHIEYQMKPDPNGAPLVVLFRLCGAPYMVLNGGPHYTLTPAASIVIMTDDQAETDRLWDTLIANGGQESQCGWLIDRFGVSWQITPKILPKLFGHPDPAVGQRVGAAMMGMKRIVIADLERAAAGA